MTARAAAGLSDGITLKDQWRLALTATRDPKLSRLQLAVLIEVTDRSYKAKGNSRAARATWCRRSSPIAVTSGTL